jgi:hypothetical protein
MEKFDNVWTQYIVLRQLDEEAWSENKLVSRVVNRLPGFLSQAQTEMKFHMDAEKNHEGEGYKGWKATWANMRMKVLQVVGEEESTEEEDSESEPEEEVARAQVTKKNKVQHAGDDGDMVNTRAYQEGYNMAMATRSFAQMQQNQGGRGFRGRGQWRG